MSSQRGTVTCARSLMHLQRTSGLCPASSPGSPPLVSRPPAQAPPAASPRRQAGRDGRSSPRRQAEEGGGQRAEAGAGSGEPDCGSARVVSAGAGRERHRRGYRTSRPNGLVESSRFVNRFETRNLQACNLSRSLLLERGAGLIPNVHRNICRGGRCGKHHCWWVFRMNFGRLILACQFLTRQPKP